MKTLRWTVSVVIAMSFIVGLGVLAWSGPIKLKPHLKKLMGCPQGWHIKSGTGAGVVACIPDEPVPTMECSEGWGYYFTGCEVGCKKIIPPPR
jgi:hypothetical protein